MADLECPYCDTEIDINHDDGFGYAEETPHRMECHECEKSFIFQTTISFFYEPEKADCLNGSVHKWKPRGAYPADFPLEYIKLYCEACDEERPATEADHIKRVKSDD